MCQLFQLDEPYGSPSDQWLLWLLMFMDWFCNPVLLLYILLDIKFIATTTKISQVRLNTKRGTGSHNQLMWVQI